MHRCRGLISLLAFPALLSFSCGSDKNTANSLSNAEAFKENLQTASTSQESASSAADRFDPFARQAAGQNGSQDALKANQPNQSFVPKPPPKPKVRVSLTDFGLDSVEFLKVTFTKVDLEYTPTGGSQKTVTIFEGEREEDVIALSKGLLKGFGEVTLDPGVVTQVRLITKSAQLKFKDENFTRTVTIPSGSETGLKLIGNIPLEMGKEIELVIDFDVEKSLVILGNGGIHLKPTIKVFSIDELHEKDNLPEGNHKVLITGVSDKPDPFSSGTPEWRASKRPSQDLSFLVEVRKTGELKAGPGELVFFTWRLNFSSLQRGNTPGIVKEYSDTTCIAGPVGPACPSPLATPLSDPVKFTINVNFSGREDDPDAATAFADGLYVYVFNTAVVVTKEGKQPQGKGNPKGACGGNGKGKGKGQGQDKCGGNGPDQTSNMATGKDDLRVIDRDKFYGSVRIDSTSPKITNVQPIHKYLFSHPTPQHTVVAVDPIAGEESFSGLNIPTWTDLLNGKDIINDLQLNAHVTEPERFASRGPDRVFQEIRAAVLNPKTHGVVEGFNKIEGSIEDMAENLGLAMDSGRKVTTTKFFVDTVDPILSWTRLPNSQEGTPPEGLITNNPNPETILSMTDPIPSSGLRLSTLRMEFHNDDVPGISFQRTLEDGTTMPSMVFAEIEPTDPFQDIPPDPADKFPRVATATFTPPNFLPDGDWTLTGTIYDRSTESGNAYNPSEAPVHFGQAVVHFCVDTVNPDITILDVHGKTDNQPAQTQDPIFRVQCGDRFPSCGVQSITLTATRTHGEGFETPEALPQPVPYVFAIPLSTACPADRIDVSSFKLSQTNPSNLQQYFGQTLLPEGVWNFKVEVKDKATNVSSDEMIGIILDVSNPLMVSIRALDGSGNELGFHTNVRPWNVELRYRNGLSGVDLNKVTASLECYSTCDVPPVGSPKWVNNLTAQLSKTANKANASPVSPCEGLNILKAWVKDNAGNGPVAGSNMYCGDFRPPVIESVDIESFQCLTGWTTKIIGGKPFPWPVYGTCNRIRAVAHDNGSGLRGTSPPPAGVRIAGTARPKGDQALSPNSTLANTFDSPTIWPDGVWPTSLNSNDYQSSYFNHHIVLAATDKAGNVAIAPMYRNGRTSPLTVVSADDATLTLPGGLGGPFFLTLVDVSQSDFNRDFMQNRNVFLGGESLVTFAYAVRQRFSSSGSTLCVPEPPGLDSNRQIFIVRPVAQKFVVAAGTTRGSGRICSSEIGGIPGLGWNTTLLFVQMNIDTSLYVGSVAQSGIALSALVSALTAGQESLALFFGDLKVGQTYAVPMPRYPNFQQDIHYFTGYPGGGTLLFWYDLPANPGAGTYVGPPVDVDGAVIDAVRIVRSNALGSHLHESTDTIQAAVQTLYERTDMTAENLLRAEEGLLALATKKNQFDAFLRGEAIKTLGTLARAVMKVNAARYDEIVNTFRLIIAPCCKDKSTYVRASAAEAMGVMNETRFNDVLLEAVRGDSGPVAMAANSAYFLINRQNACNVTTCQVDIAALGALQAPRRAPAASSFFGDEPDGPLAERLFLWAQEQVFLHRPLPFGNQVSLQAHSSPFEFWLGEMQVKVCPAERTQRVLAISDTPPDWTCPVSLRTIPVALTKAGIASTSANPGTLTEQNGWIRWDGGGSESVQVKALDGILDSRRAFSLSFSASFWSQYPGAALTLGPLGFGISDFESIVNTSEAALSNSLVLVDHGMHQYTYVYYPEIRKAWIYQDGAVVGTRFFEGVAR